MSEIKIVKSRICNKVKIEKRYGDMIEMEYIDPNNINIDIYGKEYNIKYAIECIEKIERVEKFIENNRRELIE